MSDKPEELTVRRVLRPGVAPLPSMTWRMLSNTAVAPELPKGLDAAWDTAAGLLRRVTRRRGQFLARAHRVLDLDKEITALTDARLREAAMEMRDLFRTGRDSSKDQIRAMAIVREVCFRQRGEKPYHVQVAGALALHNGCVVEMATGEGKTLTATMPAVLAGWRGRGCHVITVNDYLAKRDALSMAKIYNFCGLTVNYLEGETEEPARREAYNADITYCTNKEVCADFLRDRLVLGRMRDLASALLAKMLSGQGTDRLVMRGLHYAIIDEADSVLIDEAVTPLIISGDVPNGEQIDAYKQSAAIAGKLAQSQDYTVNRRYREIELTDSGADKVAVLAEPLGGVWAGARRREELVIQALTAREFYLLGKQYVLDDGKVVIVDEFTGRLMPDRNWREGLHQSIEAKEAVTVNPPKDTFARVSFQRFFRLYKGLCGMTGTAAEAKAEVWQIYHRPVIVIPTHRPCMRAQLPDRIYATESAKWAAVVQDIKRLHLTGRPILVGTRSVRASERLSELLTAENLPHAVLNAVRHAEEAQIVAGAGQPGHITVATNMAGRGTDIKLGRGVAELGGLHVMATERHEARRVDRQLFGRAGRQGDPGSAQAFVSLEDELVTRHAPRLTTILRGRYGNRVDELTGSVVRRLFEIAQHRAQRHALAQRKNVLKSDDYLDESLGFAGSER